MIALTSAELVERTEVILEDTGNAVFLADAISSQLQDALKKASFYIPWMVRQTLFAIAGSRELDLSTIDNLRYIQDIEYPIDRDPRRFRNFSEFHNTLRMDIDSKPTAGIQQKDNLLTTGQSNQVLTGTVTFTANSTAVTGSGTAFTTELRVGYYISPTSGTVWYRVAKITDDTNLVLAEVVKTADGGANTGTYYWFQPVYLYCAKNHYVEKTQTDFVGAIDLAAGYAKDSGIVRVDALGTGTMPRDMLFTIAGVDGVYRITDDATIGTNEADIFFDPPLKGVAGNDAVVTFYGSSLTDELEAIIPDYTAGLVARNWVGNARTQIASAITLHTTITTAIGKLGTEAVLAIDDLAKSRTEINKVDISGVVTAVNQIQKQVDRAEAEIKAGKAFIGKKNDAAIDLLNKVEERVDKAISDVGMAKSKIVDRTTEAIASVDAMAAQTTLGIADLASGRALQNLIPIGGNPVVKYIQSAGSQYQAAVAKSGEAVANLRVRGMGTEHLNGAGVELQAGLAKVSLANSYLNVDRPSTLHNNNAARELQAANTLFSKANVLLNLDVKSAPLVRNAQVEIQAGNAYLGQGNSYLNQLAARLRIVNSVNTLQVWADRKIEESERKLKGLSKPRQKNYNYPRS